MTSGKSDPGYKRSVKALVNLSFITCLLVICGCHCDPVTIRNYDYSNFMALNLDNTGPEPVIASGNSVPKEAYGLRINTDISIIGSTPPINNSGSDLRCVKTQWHPLRSIQSITIISTDDFDSSHPAGSDLTGLFKIFTGTSYAAIP